MDHNLEKLYSTLGYRGPLPKTSANAEVSETGTVLEAAVVERSTDPAEIPPLDPEGLRALEIELKRNPEETLTRAREVIDKNLTEEELRTLLSQADMALSSPETAVPAIEAEAFHMEKAIILPEEFDFPGMDLEEIPINAGDHKFETVGDALGWVIHAGPFILTKASKDNFRWHSRPDVANAQFIYSLPEPTDNSPLNIALFSDFGNGRYHARYIAKQLRQRKFPLAIHLGDVYYAGRRSEFEEFFNAPLEPMLEFTQLFVLNSNHEMYSASIPYFEFMDQRRASHPDKQKQEGSYFCLRSSKFQIVGIDTAYFGQGRYRDPGLLEWLAKTLDDGRRAGCLNILLSADHPYEYGKTNLAKLLERDVADIVFNARLVDLWFWGNTHYCALFDSSNEIPFVGSCIGHAGYPYDRQRLGKESPAPVKFLETAARFPEWTNVRQDRGNNGYCVMSLKSDGSITLKYVDWMSQQRCQAELKQAAGNRFSVASVQLGD